MRKLQLLTAFACLLALSFSPRASAQIDLADVIKGGDGTGNAPAANIGLDPRTGLFTTVLFGGRIAPTDAADDGMNPSPGDSALIDSVFFIGPFADFPAGAGFDTFLQPINLDGVEMEFPNADGIATGWNPHMANGNAGGGAAGTFDVGGSNIGRGVGIHSSTGVTFDLDAMRAAHGDAAVGCFQTFWGMDACNGDVILYAILSDTVETLSVQTFNALQNSGELLQMEIPDEAVYLTLATGSNGADGCDHGNFGIASIVASCEAPVTESVAITPAAASIPPTGVVQLTVRATDSLGLSLDVSDQASYSAAPAGVVSISATGAVTGLADGVATITATFDGESGQATITVAARGYLDLGDIAVGGNGLGNADPLNIGINADTGFYAQARIGANVTDTDGFNPQPVIDTDFVDSVFIITQDVGMPINQDLVPFDFAVGDTATGWENILNGREPGGADSLEFGPGVLFEEGVGIHAAQGITYDLEALRVEHGADAVRFVSAVAGELTSERNGAGHVNTYMILSNEDEIIDVRSFLDARNVGRFLQMEIPEEAVFLTLAVGAAGDGIGSDHGGFGLARVTSREVETEVAELRVTPSALVLDIGGTQQLLVAAVLGGELAGVTTELDLAEVSFSSSDDAVAEVDDDGLVTGEAAGDAVITVTLGALSVDVTVQVGTIIELSDIVGGGDGSGTAPLENIGIDPRNGLFVQFGIDGHVYEVDAEGDGLNPSPVDESDFVDSVFFIGERAVGGPAPVAGGILEQEITQSGIIFEFPSQDGFGSSWNHILSNLNGGGGAAPVLVGGVGYDTGIGLHAAAGITFDLEVVREEYGPEAAAIFSTQMGMDGCAGDVNLYVILSNEADGVIATETFNATANTGRALVVNIPSTASYLTLATGSNGADGCDHGNFAQARLISGEVLTCPDDGDTHCDGLEVTGVTGPNVFGLFAVEVSARGTDDSGDAVSYRFELRDALGALVRTIGPQASGDVTLQLTAGNYTLDVTVDDEAICSDAAADNSCSIEICLGDDCAAGGFVRGDSDASGTINLADGIQILNFLFQGGPAPACLDAADTDNGGSLQLTDGVRIFNYLFLGGAAPAAPSPGAPNYAPADCGPDSGASLGCARLAAKCS